MNIVSGLYKGRKIVYSNKLSLRPSLARVRKMVMDTLMPLLFNNPMELKILDAFAGTGAYGFEALSIFGGYCTLVDMDRNLVKNMKETISTIGIGTKAKAIMGNALVVVNKLAKEYFNLIFIDPPYEKTFLIRKILKRLLTNQSVDENTYIVVENSVHNKWFFISDEFHIIKDKQAASTRFMILKPKKEALLKIIEEAEALKNSQYEDIDEDDNDEDGEDDEDNEDNDEDDKIINKK